MAVLVYTTGVGPNPNIVELVTPALGTARVLVQALTTDIVEESSSAPNPGQSLTDTLNQIRNILIADVGNGRPGYVARFVWVNAASSRIGTQFAGVEVTAPPVAWLTEADMPPGNVFHWVQYGAGGGSGSGAATRGATGSASIGGGGPSGGAYRHEWTATRADLIAALPIFFTVPLGGDPGAAVASGSTAIVPGNGGVAGGLNLISGQGLREAAYGGGPGGPGTSPSTGTAGAGGGLLSGGGVTGNGGMPNDASTLTSGAQYWDHGGCAANSRTSTGTTGTSNYGINGGAGGGTIGNGTAIIHGGRSKRGGCGGGCGGRYSLLSGLVAGSATDGGNHDVETLGNPGGGGGGVGGSVSGQSGQAGPDGNLYEGGQGGGGGFAASGTSSATAIGGAGGPGGFPGGGSGGGGASFSSAITGVATSGAGVRGGDGATILTILL